MTLPPSSATGPGDPEGIGALAEFVERHARLFVLTGAGVSTSSGIPDYRDLDGNWKRRPPVQYGPFVRDEHVRRRYWARSALGWPGFARSRPGVAHDALARLQRAGRVHALVTQNVDRLHQRAGSDPVIDLHGRLDVVVCLGCSDRTSRDDLQRRLLAANPRFAGLRAPAAPDGDADLGDVDLDDFEVPACARCGGTLKPDVVFFGESVPKPTVEASFRALGESDAVLVVGSSLMVWSGFRFARAAAESGKPIAAVNRGVTRADDRLALKLDADCGDVLRRVAGAIAPGDGC